MYFKNGHPMLAKRLYIVNNNNKIPDLPQYVALSVGGPTKYCINGAQMPLSKGLTGKCGRRILTR